MKKWVCKVCGYVHEGEAPPATCPVCGVGPEDFVQEESTAVKRWKCTVCDYIHVGDEPPEVCPLCGVGKENFVLLAGEPLKLTPESIASADEATCRSAIATVSYGLYVVASKSDGKLNGQLANSVFQLTDNPLQIAICINKRNLTHDYIQQSGIFTVSVLKTDQMDYVRSFGYSSGRTVDKFATIEYLPGQNGCPVLKECAAYVEATVSKAVDVGTHTLFISTVTAGRLISDEEPLTYAHYRDVKRKNV